MWGSDLFADLLVEIRGRKRLQRCKKKARGYIHLNLDSKRESGWIPDESYSGTQRGAKAAFEVKLRLVISWLHQKNTSQLKKFNYRFPSRLPSDINSTCWLTLWPVSSVLSLLLNEFIVVLALDIQVMHLQVMYLVKCITLTIVIAVLSNDHH